METETITYQKPGTETGNGLLSVTVGEATALMGMKRTRLRQLAKGAEGEDLDQQLLHYLIYPDLLGATVAAEGFEMPIPFEAFCLLPDEFVAEWEERTYSLNPHWILKSEDEDEKTPDPNPADSTDS